jgi:hypothetical protein
MAPQEQTSENFPPLHRHYLTKPRFSREAYTLKASSLLDQVHHQITFEIPIHLWHPVKNGGVLDPEFDSA